MSEFIKPTIGRKVYYFPLREQSYRKESSSDSAMVQFNNEGPVKAPLPLDATIVYVWNDTCVNLLVVDHEGYAFRRQKVSINCGKNIIPRAEWMDYQKGQAAKTEQLEAAVDELTKGRIAQEVGGGGGYTDSDISKMQAGAPSPLDGKR